MSNALIGYTGFVGSNLLHQFNFEQVYNSKNIESIAGKKFDLLVCAGVSAVKWLANQEPVADLQNINYLKNCLSKTSAKTVTLISTVDVYPLPILANEDTVIDINKLQPYGKHRLEFENFVKNNFDTTIIRLPGLFGKGLKKNIIYDFLHNNLVDNIHKNSIFQFYYLAHLWQDIEVCLKHNLKLVNFATEPTSVQEIAGAAFGFDFTNVTDKLPVKYDFRTKYGAIFGNKTEYIYNKKQMLQELKNFIQDNKDIQQ